MSVGPSSWKRLDEVRRCPALDLHEQLCPRNQRCQREQIRFCRKVDYLCPRVLPNYGDVPLFFGGRPACQDKIKVFVLAEVFNRSSPAFRFPELFVASRAGMQNQVGSRDFRIAPKRISFFVCGLRQVQLRTGGSSAEAERFQQCQIVINRVHVPHANTNEVAVKTGACLRLVTHPVRSDASVCGGQKRKKRRAIIAREINAVIESLAGERKKRTNIAEISLCDHNPVNIGDGWQQLRAFLRNRERQVCIRKTLAQRPNRGRCQNQVTDSLELQEKNFHPPSFRYGATGRLPVHITIISPFASRFRTHPAIVFENGPR